MLYQQLRQKNCPAIVAWELSKKARRLAESIGRECDGFVERGRYPNEEPTEISVDNPVTGLRWSLWLCGPTTGNWIRNNHDALGYLGEFTFSGWTITVAH
tara:strand:+ start:8537 stop:8836 length:300 start_codon:yes stop_codon:yes gene_type:complete